MTPCNRRIRKTVGDASPTSFIQRPGGRCGGPRRLEQSDHSVYLGLTSTNYRNENAGDNQTGTGDSETTYGPDQIFPRCKTCYYIATISACPSPPSLRFVECLRNTRSSSQQRRRCCLLEQPRQRFELVGPGRTTVDKSLCQFLFTGQRYDAEDRDCIITSGGTIRRAWEFLEQLVLDRAPHPPVVIMCSRFPELVRSIWTSLIGPAGELGREYLACRQRRVEAPVLIATVEVVNSPVDGIGFAVELPLRNLDDLVL